MIRRLPIYLLAAIAVLQWRCIQSYISPFVSPATGYLVVEGYLSSNAPSFFRLSRSIPLSGDSSIPVVAGAHLVLEGTDGSTAEFADSGGGIYYLPPVDMSAAFKYRLRIENANDETYLSNWISYKPTPPIDSVNWASGPSGVNIYVTTHDPTGETKYYQWKYVETWEVNSGEQSSWIWTGDSLIPRTPSQQIFTCWHSDSATALVIGTSEQLARDEIYEQPVVTIPVNTAALGIEYSILVNEYALTDSAYHYYQMMKGTTEDLGSVFDALPTQLTGNFHSLTHPSEPVLGYICAGTVQQKRIFILRYQVPNWLYFFECPLPDISFPTLPDSLKYYFGRGYYTPITSSGISNVTANYTSCVDCRAQDAGNQRPSWWP